jgi:hypothetical protein
MSDTSKRASALADETADGIITLRRKAGSAAWQPPDKPSVGSVRARERERAC